MSCMSFLTPEQRAALAASTADGAPLSSFASPPASEGKVRRIRGLAGSPDPRIRESAALAYHAPADVLARLVADPVASVRACVARNEHTPVELLRRLATDPVPAVRGWVAAHRDVPADVLAGLEDDTDAAVRAVVAWAAGWERV